MTFAYLTNMQHMSYTTYKYNICLLRYRKSTGLLNKFNTLEPSEAGFDN